jgi:hypothetical protein
MATMQVNRLSALTPSTITPVTTAETVVLTSAPYTYDMPNPFVGTEHAGTGQGVRINGVVYFSNTGASTTSQIVRVRQGGLTGTIIGGISFSQNVTAAGNAVIAYDEIDTSRFAAGGGVYVVTVQAVAATGNPTVQEATMCIQGA